MGHSRTACFAVLVALSSLFVSAEEGEKEETTSPVACAISVMLLGTIGFQMILFYLTNHSDDDMRRYTWQVISTTISIFCAVLLFQAFDTIITVYFIEGCSPAKEFGIDMAHMLFWLTCLQLVLAKTSGAIGEPPAGGLKAVTLNMKCWAVLFAHIAGFSAINAWGSLQHLEFFSSSPWRAALVVPTAAAGLGIIYMCFDHIREWVAMGDDGEVDLYEEAWNLETGEAENDIAGLVLSFLTCQAVRFSIAGALPSEEGVETEDIRWTHPVSQDLALFGIGVLGACLSVAALIFSKHMFNKKPHQKLHAHEKLVRFTVIANDYFCKSFSWCVFYSSSWALGGFLGQWSREETLVRVSNALFLSCISFAGIFLLDMLDDYLRSGNEAAQLQTAVLRKSFLAERKSRGSFLGEYTLPLLDCSDRAASMETSGGDQVGDQDAEQQERDDLDEINFDAEQDAMLSGKGDMAQMVIETLVESCLGILVGFSWEQSFDVAVESISLEGEQHNVPKQWTRLVLSFVLVSIVLPAWYLYILPEELRLGKHNERKLREETLKWSDQFTSLDATEEDLDLRHLVVKQIFRETWRRPMHKNLSHYRVTGRGILEVLKANGLTVNGDGTEYLSLQPSGE